MDYLENGILSAEINPKGAELYSLQLDGLERIWGGDPTIWGRHAPLLFPFIGRLECQQYELDGQVISAPMHGFCRDRVFQRSELTPTRVCYRTQDDQDTYAVYPFHFTLEVEFELEENTLIKRHRVTNRSHRVMPFELGGHDAYRTTLIPGETMADYAIAFEGLDHLEPFAMDENGMLNLPKGNIPLEKGLLTKLPQEVGLDTIVLEGLPVRKAALVSRKSERRVTVEFDDFPYLGIWTAQKGVPTNYICIEPWSTLPDGHFMGRRLEDKPGIVLLSPGESKTLSFRTTFE